MDPNGDLNTQQTGSTQQAFTVQPTVTPSINMPVQSVVVPTPKKPKSYGLIVGLIVAVITIGLGSAAYIWRDAEANKQKDADTARIKDLHDEIAGMKKTSSNSVSNELDTERKNELARLTNNIVNYQSNNRGATPTESNWATFIDNYLEADGSTFSDPSGKPFIFNLKGELPSKFDASNPVIAVTMGATCSGSEILADQGTRKFAFRMRLSSGKIYCINN